VLAVDASDPQVVFVNGDHTLERSLDGGASWTTIFGEDPVAGAFDATGAFVLVGDRGVYRTPDRGITWAHRQGNLQITQFHTIALDPTNPDIVYGTAHDHVRSMKFTGTPVWNYTGGGYEYGKILVDPATPNTLYDLPNRGAPELGDRLRFIRSEDGGANWLEKTNGIDTTEGSADHRAIAIDSSNPSRLLVGTTRVYQTTDRAESWRAISPTLSSGTYPGNVLTEIAIAPSRGQTIYAGTADGGFFASDDGGTSWQKRSTGLPINSILDIQIDPADHRNAYVAMGYPARDRVWFTSNGGTTWTNATGDLPAAHWVQTMVVDWRFVTPVLYVGTGRGAYRSLNDGTTWSRSFATGLPNTEVTDLQFLPHMGILAAGTFGRGVFEIILPPPVPTAPDLLNDDDSGTTATDNRTNLRRPRFTGTGWAGASRIELVEGATVIATGALDPVTGVWTLQPATALADGQHTIAARVADQLGHLSNVSAAITVTIDATPPLPPATPDLVAASDLGVSASDDITSDNTPTFSGTAEANTVVTVYSDVAVPLGTATAGGAGTWSFTSPALADGSHQITALAADTAGNVGELSEALSITIDTTPPAEMPSTPDLVDAGDSGSSAGDNITNVVTPTFTGTAPAGAIVAVLDGTTVRGTTVSDAGGVWSFTSPALGQGLHAITARVMDAAGNLGPASAPLSVTIDTTAAAPAALDLTAASDSGISSSDNTTNITTPTITGTAESLSTVTVSSDIAGTLGVALADAAGNSSFSSPMLADGLHRVTARATDVAGNTSGSSAALSVRIDTQAPAAPPLPDLAATRDSGASNSDNITNVRSPTFTGTSEAGSRVSVISNIAGVLSTVTANTSGVWSFTGGNLVDGDHQITVTATDLAGNTSGTSPALPVTIDTTRPLRPSVQGLDPTSDTGISDGDNITQNTRPILRGTAEAGATVAVALGGLVLGTTVADDGTWNLPTPALSDGVYGVTATATDAAGNASVSSPPLLMTIDTTIVPPATPALDAASDTGNSNSDQITGTTTPTLMGTAEPGSSVAILEGNIQLNLVSADAAGLWHSNPNLSEGTHAITAQATDSAGNTSELSGVLNVTIDTTVPSAPSAADLDPASDSGRFDSDDYTNDPAPLLRGTADPDNMVEVFDGPTSLGTAVANNTGDWSFRPSAPLGDGEHHLAVIASDSAGNGSVRSGSLRITIDTVAPSQPAPPNLDRASDTGASRNDGLTNDQTPTFRGSADPTSAVELFDAAISLGVRFPDPGGDWTLTSDRTLSPADHQVFAKITDLAGNTSPASTPLRITIDLQGPTITSRELDRVRGRVTGIRLAFSAALDSAQALQDVGKYQLTLGRRAGALTAAVYDPDTRSVQLTFRKPIAAARLPRATLRISGQSGIADLIGNLLDGDGDGRPGGDFVLRLFDARFDRIP
jgi:hypothetical protein